MSGVPFVTATDISGNWYAQGMVSDSGISRETFTEFFTLDNMAALAGSATKAATLPEIFTDIASSPVGGNAYLVTGSGPRYTNYGVALLSSKKRLGLVVREGDFATEQTILRAVEGPINTNKSTATLQGTDDNDANVRFQMRKFVTIPVP
jgi:hypothetical protein